MTTNLWVKPNNTEVAAKVIDGEAIMINLSNGTYYSMLGVGGAIWELLADGITTDQLVAEIVRRYEVALEMASADLTRLLETMVSERLVVVSDASASAPITKTPNSSRLPYEAPKIEIFTDMGDLLALDPPMPGLDDIPWARVGEPSRTGH